ncbi:MAG: methyltransferase domain-containing protein [Bryobacterales bacterium]|nr:methyltransferase domain-containing protein [Bryobacterales bacterium]
MTSRPLPTGANPPPSDLPPGARRSHALENVSAYLRAHQELQVLDFGGINQPNLDFVTGLGHRIYGENLMLAFDYFFSQQEVASRQFAPERVEQFLDQTFDFEDQSCDAAFLWDTLQFLPPNIAQGVLGRLYRVLAPDSLLMAFFHPENSGPAAPHVCRILDDRNLQLTPRQHVRAIVPFSTRSIERFFQQFQSVKFFLTRENLQEVIARR